MKKSASFFAFLAILSGSHAQAVVITYENDHNPHYIHEAYTRLSSGANLIRFEEPLITLSGTNSSQRPYGVTGFLSPGTTDVFCLTPEQNTQLIDHFNQDRGPIVMRLFVEYKDRPRTASEESWADWNSNILLHCDAFTIFPNRNIYDFNEILDKIKITIGLGECIITLPNGESRKLRSAPSHGPNTIDAFRKIGEAEQMKLLEIIRKTPGPIGWGLNGVVVPFNEN